MLVLVSSSSDSAIGCGSREKTVIACSDAVLEDLKRVLVEAADEMLGVVGDGDGEQDDVRAAAEDLLPGAGVRRGREHEGRRCTEAGGPAGTHLPPQCGASSFAPDFDVVTSTCFGGMSASGRV